MPTVTTDREGPCGPGARGRPACRRRRLRFRWPARVTSVAPASILIVLLLGLPAPALAGGAPGVKFRPPLAGSASTSLSLSPGACSAASAPLPPSFNLTKGSGGFALRANSSYCRSIAPPHHNSSAGTQSAAYAVIDLWIPLRYHAAYPSIFVNISYSVLGWLTEAQGSCLPNASGARSGWVCWSRAALSISDSAGILDNTTGTNYAPFAAGRPWLDNASSAQVDCAVSGSGVTCRNISAGNRTTVPVSSRGSYSWKLTPSAKMARADRYVLRIEVVAEVVVDWYYTYGSVFRGTHQAASLDLGTGANGFRITSITEL